jgi:DMSO/TMAO reductase YedYZ molybdopterin-dependent catalytic subunit
VSAAAARRRTRRAFLGWAGGLAAGGGLIAWVRTRALEDGIPWPLRRVHEFNAWVGRQLFSPTRRATDFPPDRAADPRVNGWRGAPPEGGPDHGVTVEVPGRPPVRLTAAEVVAGLPRAEDTTELKCIEGWSEVVTWGGVRFADVAGRLGVGPTDFPFVALSTTDGAYYVGLDAASAFHPQTLLCDRMNGRPLPHGHGGPLRLVIPVKYGIKNLKWVAAVRFAAARPADYWAERGYDWYAGL